MELNTKAFSVALSGLTISSASAFYSYITSDKQKEVVAPAEKPTSKHKAGTYEYCLEKINSKRVCGWLFNRQRT